MKRKIAILLCLFPAVFVVCGCKSITCGRTDLAIPHLTVVFSFDDGPNTHDDTTSRLLDVLRKYEIKAMFALIGENAEAYPELVRRIYNEGHYLINHGYSENWAIRMDDDEFRYNLLRGGEAISLALGREFEPRLYRPHGGFYDSRQESICFEEGYTIVPCNIRVYDAVLSKDGMEKVIDSVVKKTIKQDGGIILLHDARESHLSMEKNLEKNPQGAYNRSWIPGAVEKIIEALIQNGFDVKGDYHPE